MTYLTDLEDWKIDARISPGYVKEFHIINNPQTGQRKALSEKIWQTGRVIGSGRFGEVQIQTCLDDQRIRAVKCIRMARKELESAKELQALLEISKKRHKNAAVFVDFLGWFDDSENERVYIAMEYLPLGDLENYVNEHGLLSEEEIKEVTQQILEGLRIMHLESFVHRDLKPQNILICQHSPIWWVKIADFGLSTSLDVSLSISGGGTFSYMAPELFGLVSKGSGAAVDLWALGCIIYRLAVGKLPIPHEKLLEYCSGGTFLPHGALLSIPGLELVKSLLSPDPLLRPSANEALQSVWITESNHHRLSQEQPYGSSSITPNWYNSNSHPVFRSTMASDHGPTREPAAEHGNSSLPENQRVNRESMGRQNNTPLNVFAASEPERSSLPTLRKRSSSTCTQIDIKGLLGILPEGPVAQALAKPGAESAVRYSMEAVFTVDDLEFEAQAHEYEVASSSCIAFSPDSLLLATGDRLGNVRLWETKTGRTMKTLSHPSHSDLINISSISFSPNGRLLVAVYSRIAMIWDMKTELLLRVLVGHGSMINRVAFSPDGKLVATASKDCRAMLWESEEELLLNLLAEDASYFSDVIWRGIVGVKSAGLGTLNAKPRLTLIGHTDDVSSVTFSPDGAMIATASEDYSVRLWETKTGRCFKILQGHEASVCDVAFCPHTRKLAASLSNSTCVIWGVGSWDRLMELSTNRKPKGSSSVAFSPDGQVMVMGSIRSVCIFRMSSGEYRKVADMKRVEDVAFSPDGTLIATAAFGPGVSTWQLKRKGSTSWWRQLLS